MVCFNFFKDFVKGFVIIILSDLLEKILGNGVLLPVIDVDGDVVRVIFLADYFFSLKDFLNGDDFVMKDLLKGVSHSVVIIYWQLYLMDFYCHNVFVNSKIVNLEVCNFRGQSIDRGKFILFKIVYKTWTFYCFSNAINHLII